MAVSTMSTCAVFIALLLATLSSVSGKIPQKDIPARIPPAITPVLYDLLIHPHLNEGTFSGTVNIQFDLKSALKFLPVHQHGLTILRTDLTGAKGKLNVREAYKINSLDYWLIEPTETMEAGSYNITMTFTGNMKNKINGLYKSSYKSPNSSVPKYLSTTKFEPTYARHSFPCFDEPMFKAKFKVRVIRPKDGGYHALGNADIVSETTGPTDDEMVVEFRDTPPVATYLIAYIVSDFKTLGPVSIENPGGANFTFQVWSAPHLVDHTAFARNMAQQSVSYFIKYFNIPYPLPKMDFVAIPDFPSGAMENWGLVTFRETDLIANNETGGMLPALYKIAHVTAHELAHQWFGNLVTMKWWSDIWLNEGFARFMQFKGVLEGTTEGAKWKGDLPCIEDVIMAVMSKDALLSTHAVINDASSPAAITEVFDMISYGKGAAILNMIEHLLGKETFMNGVRKYLKAHQLGNAESADLWSALSEASGLSLNDSMETWLKQPGFPILNVRRAKKSVYITQNRFVSDKDKTFVADSSPFGFKWDVPVIYRTSQSDKQRVAWLYRNMSELVLDVGKSSPWLKLNYKLSGYYRVNYDMGTWMAIIEQLDEDHNIFTPEDRANLLDDAFALASGGYLPFSVPLEMVRVYFKKETDRLPMLIGLHRLSSIGGKLSKKHKKILRNFRKAQVSALYDKLLGHYEWDFSKKQVNRQLEVELMTFACKNNLPQCKTPVEKYFKQFIQNQTAIVPDFQLLVYSTGTKGAKEDVLKSMFNRFQSCYDPIECKILLSSLMGSGNKKYIAKLLTLGINDKILRRQDFFSALAMAASSNRDFTWSFLRKNYKLLIQKFGADDRHLGSSIVTVASKYNTKEKLAEVKLFLKEHEGISNMKNGKMTVVEKIMDNMMLEKRLKSVGKYFEALSKADKDGGKIKKHKLYITTDE